MNVYFELSESVKHDLNGRYFVVYGLGMTEVREKTRYLGLMMNSDRAWEESEHGVRFIKNRTLDIKTAEVDMKEFFWIKLKSVKV
jgi:hypothetical protein